MSPSPEPDIEAEIRLLTTEEGGKNTPCRTGYFPNHDFGIEGTLSDVRHIFPDVAEVWPGDTVRSLMTFMTPEIQRGRLYEGFTFTVQEGGRVIGHGRVTRVLNKALERP